MRWPKLLIKRTKGVSCSAAEVGTGLGNASAGIYPFAWMIVARNRTCIGDATLGVDNSCEVAKNVFGNYILAGSSFRCNIN